MSKKENENILSLGKKVFESNYDVEEVPYLNNNGDTIQDMLKEVQQNTEELTQKIDREDNNNVLQIDFTKNGKR